MRRLVAALVLVPLFASSGVGTGPVLIEPGDHAGGLHPPLGGTAAPGLDGTRTVTAVIDDGQVHQPADLTQGGLLVVAGQTITTFNPKTGAKKELLFVNDPAASPATLDLGGAAATSGLGIYVLAGDTLMVALAGPGINVRPTTFASPAGSHALLMTLKRAPAGATPAAPLIPPPPPAPVAGKLTDPAVTTMLVGTWGYQDGDKVVHETLNADGTFSATTTWKKAVRNLFEEDARTSGTWKVLNGVAVMAVTASTDPGKRGQVYSFRVNSITDRDLIYIDPNGQVRQQWKTR